ncbi:hypothetical protein APHAL10511_006594 [Amanita phalloides]|nr:hypothetical protein APHAL10511_006594 [Amanita phalloides]
MSSNPQDGSNSVDTQIPTVDLLHLNARTSAPITPRNKTTLVYAEMKKIDYAYNKDDTDNMKQGPNLGDGEIPLAELMRNKRRRVSAATSMGTDQTNATAPVTDQVFKTPKVSKKASFIFGSIPT